MSCQSCKQSKLRKVKNILEGFSKLIVTNDATEELANRRLSICNTCPNSKRLARVGGKDINRCVLCSCLTEAKARAKDEQCPDGKW